MEEKRVLTIQDISCVGQCSITVALPIISACGIECGILPSSVLSNHTAGFSGWTFCDLTDEMPLILEQWKRDNITFNAFYTGYVTKSHIPHILNIMNGVARPGALRIVDPVMGDYGRFYPGFDNDFVTEMKRLVDGADVILPNITEATMLLGEPYPETYDRAYIEDIMKRLLQLGCKNVVLTGVAFEPGKVGVMCYDGTTMTYYVTDYISGPMHSTGDCYASSFTGALMRGFSIPEAAAIAADFVAETVRQTIPYKNHWYGVNFEKALPYLIERLNH